MVCDWPEPSQVSIVCCARTQSQTGIQFSQPQVSRTSGPPYQPTFTKMVTTANYVTGSAHHAPLLITWTSSAMTVQPQFLHLAPPWASTNLCVCVGGSMSITRPTHHRFSLLLSNSLFKYNWFLDCRPLLDFQGAESVVFDNLLVKLNAS